MSQFSCGAKFSSELPDLYLGLMKFACVKVDSQTQVLANIGESFPVPEACLSL